MKDNNFKSAFLYGYLYAKAEDIKEKGLFQDFTIKELIKYLIKTYKD